MPGELDNPIDIAQAELASAAAKEGTGVIKGVEEIFKPGGLVDNFQDLDKTLHLAESPAASKYFDTGKKEVGQLLIRMAARGKYLADNPPDKPGTAPTNKKYESGENIEMLASNLRSTLNKYQEQLTSIFAIVEKKRDAFNYLSAAYQVESSADVVNVAPFTPPVFVQVIDKALYGPDGNGGCMAVQKMLRNNKDLPAEFVQETLRNIGEKQTQRLLEIKIRGQQEQLIDNMQFGDAVLAKFFTMDPPKKPGDKPTFTFTEAGDKLSPEQKQQILMSIAGVREANYEQQEAATCPKAAERFWNGKALFEAGNLLEAKKNLEAFIKEDLSSIAISSDKKFSAKKDAYEKQAKEILSQIDKIDGDNKDFFKAQELAQSGDIIGAKKLLKKYLAEHTEKKEGQTDFTGSAKELLKRIALAQVEDARQKFNEFHGQKPPEKIPGATAGAEDQAEFIDNPDFIKWNKYHNALSQMEKDINAGKYLDFTDAYNELSKQVPGGFDAKDEVNMLADQVTLDRGREGLLELAKKYREKGKNFGDPKFLQLAEQYFTEYFGNKLNETRDKYVTIDDLRKKYYSNPTIQADISNKFDEVRDQVKKKYDEAVAKNPDWGRQNPWESYAITARNAIADKVFAQMQGDETLRMLNHHFNLDHKNVGNDADQAAWGEFVNMKGYHGQDKWFEPLALSDEQVGRLVKDLPVDIAMITAAGALAAATGGAASGLVFEATLSAVERQALKSGAQFVGRKLLASTAGFAAETFVFTASHSVMKGIQTGNFSITNLDQFAKEWIDNIETMGALGVVGRASAALRLGRLTSFGAEMSTMGSLHGKLTVDDWAMVLGLKLAHAIPEARGKIKEAVAERKAKTEIKKNAQIKIDDAAKRIGDIDFKKPDTIRSARITSDGQMIINGKLVRGFDISVFEHLPRAARERILSLSPNSALETHYRSRFSTEVPRELWPDLNNPESAKKIQGWVDSDGVVHFNLNHLNDGYIEEVAGQGPYREAPKKILPEGYAASVADKEIKIPVTGKDGQPALDENGQPIIETIRPGDLYIKGPGGKEISFHQFTKSPEGKNLLPEMVRVKNHEVTHRLLEVLGTAHGKALKGELEALLNQNSNLKSLIEQRNLQMNRGELNMQNIQEFLCEIADGRIGPGRAINLDAATIKDIENTLGRFMEGFKFKNVRRVDTKMLSRLSPGRIALMRDVAMTMSMPAMEEMIPKGQEMPPPELEAENKPFYRDDFLNNFHINLFRNYEWSELHYSHPKFNLSLSRTEIIDLLRDPEGFCASRGFDPELAESVADMRDDALAKARESYKFISELRERNKDNPLFSKASAEVPAGYVAVFHYTTEDALDGISQMGVRPLVDIESAHGRGQELMELDKFIDGFAPPGYTRTRSVYAFADLNGIAKGSAMAKGGIVLEMMVDPNKVLVADAERVSEARGHFEYDEGHAKVYWEYAMTLAEYLKRVKQGRDPGFYFPEVIIPNGVSPEKIRVKTATPPPKRKYDD